MALAIVLSSFEIALAQTQSHGIPQLCLATQAPAAFPIETRFTRLHNRDMAGRKLKREGVGVEVCTSIDFGTTFEHEDVSTEMGKTRRERAAARP